MFILNRDEEIVAVLSGNSDDSGCHFFNALLTLELNKGASLTFEIDSTESDVVRYVKEENMVVVHDGENYRLLIIKEVSDIHDGSCMKEVYCEDASAELIDEIIYDEISGKVEMGIVLASILNGTRWEVGEVDNTYIRTLKSEYKLRTVLNGIQTLANDYDAEIDFTVEFAGNKIVARKVHMKQAFGRTLGKRFEFGKDVTSIKRTVNTADIKTAIVPFGATDEETGEVLTIKDISWSKPTNPFNKPLGQTYLEDEEATELWGYKGTDSKRRARWIAIIFEDCTDANELINYAQLQLNRFNKPKISYEAEVIDLYRMMEDESYSYEKVGLGDLVNIIDHEFVPALALQSRVVKLELDLNDTSNSKVTLGTIVESIVDKDLRSQIEELNMKVSAVASSIDLSDIEDRLEEVESETGTGKWEQIQEVNNLLFSNAVGYHYMDADNGIWVFDKPVNENPTKAVALKGGMIGLAKYDSQKQVWNVGTFIDGNSVNASMINTGTLKADRIEAGALTVNHFNQELKSIITSVGNKADRTEVTTAIKTAVDEINLSVSTNYSTKAETSSAVSTAKSEAVESAVQSAKSYADTKKAEAIAEAVEDASAYADTKKSEALTEASKDAQSKANAVKNALTPLINDKASKTDVYTKSETYTKAQTDSAIKVAKDEINLGVSSTYETKTNVENKVSSAKSEAILSAVETSNSYTDAKKEEAVSEAITSANNYADNKKAEAIVQAGKDADSKVATAKADLQKNIDLKASKTDVYTKTETYTKAETDSAIKVAKDSIELGMSNKYETKTTVTNKINSAKTEAINSAVSTSKSYADTKKTEAITQAGKDADSKVNSAKTELNTKIDLKASKTDVYTKSETYTKTETDSKIKVAKDEINLSVSNNYETKTNVENKLSNITTTLTNKIDGIQVGGTNIATETNKGITGWGWSLQTGGKTATEVTENGIRCCKLVRDSVVATGWSVINYNKIGRNKYLPNRKYTVSFEVKASVVTSFYVGLREGNSSNPLTGDTKTGNTVANTWTKLSATITTLSTLPSSTSQVLYLSGMNSGTGVTYIFRNLVITEGTKASSWSPAPEDVQASIDLKAEKTDVYSKSEVYTKAQTDSAINIAKDSINLGVSQTYETKNNVTNKINTAKTEAVNSAVATSKSYADTKKAEAISTASADTTNKVNSAKTELNTKIDGIQIGGRNLFLKSNIDQYGLGNWIGNGGGIGKVEGTFIDGTKTIKVTGSSGIQYNSFIKLKRNTTYVYSMMMKSSGNMIVNSSNPLHMWLNTSETGGQHLEKVISTSGKLEANKWTKVWVVFETPNTQDVYYMKPFVYGIGTNTVYISKVQIEEGTKATDWTSAPEDVQGMIDSKANTTDVYKKSETYTKAQTDSAIKVAKDEINLGVKNTYETKTNVESKITTAVNNVQVGGRNLAQGTSNIYTTAYSSFSGGTNTCPSLAKVLTDGLVVGDTVTVKLIYKYTNIVATSGQTAKCWIQGYGNSTIWNGGTFNSSAQKVLSGSGEHTFLYSFKITPEHLKNSSWVTSIRHDYVQSGSVQWKMFKVEKGNKATDWTPAPEDVTASIDSKANKSDVYAKSETYSKTETDSKINIAKDSINLGVSQTYETKTNVTSKVNTAKTEAVNTSKSYADTKKTEAINSANATTTEKLKSYSTTAQMNSAIQVAKDNITNTVSSTYAKKADVESTYATKSSLTQTANNITASFKATGGYNLIANSTGYNDTNLWSSTGATMGTAIYNHIGGATNKYMYLDNGTKTTESFAFSKRFKLKANTKYTLSGWFHNFTKCPNFDVFLLSSTTVAEDVTDTSYTNTQLLIKAQNTSGSWKKFSITFTTPANVISGYLRIDNNGYDSSGTNSNRIHWSALMLNEGEEQPWTPHPDEVYNGSTIIDASGITINNGALTVKNNSGTTVLSGDSNGNLDITGTVKSQKGNMYVSLDYGGLTFQSAHNKEQLLRMETTAFTSNKDINGVDLNLAKQGEYISFNHINKENLNNGWSSSDGRYNFVDFWSKDTTLGSKTYKKGINVNSPMYVNKGLKLYSGTNFYADIDGSISWNNGTGTVSNLLGLYGDNGAILGYKSGESLSARFLVSEASQPGTGDNLISWGNYNFNGYTFHNANIVAKSLSVQGSKNCLQETKNYGSRLINAYETAEYYFGDIGFGQINEDGVCYIDIDDVFLECVNTDAQYHVFTQIYNGKITSIERYKTYFIVKGEQNTEFSWELKAKRKGYENNRLDTQLIDIDAVDSGLELFTDSDLNAITSENILTNVLDFNLENILLMEE